MAAGATPNAWLVPDVRTVHGIVQWAFEFPLYHALFVRGTFARGEKIPVVVRREAWLEVRQGGIGSSDAAAAVGLSPYKSPLAHLLEAHPQLVMRGRVLGSQRDRLPEER